jgi:hypothetical protein
LAGVARADLVVIDTRAGMLVHAAERVSGALGRHGGAAWLVSHRERALYWWRPREAWLTNAWNIGRRADEPP